VTRRWTETVGVSLDRTADVPVGVQLVWALGGAIRSGALAAGDRLPPLRDLADELGVNANTLRAVYAKLEAEGLIESRHGSGTFVRGARDARGLSDLVDAAARSARDAGVDPRELAAALYVTPGESPGPEAERRRQLRDEIDVLEQVLARFPHAQQPAARPSRGPRLLTLTELEAARDELVERIGAATRPPEPDEPVPAPKPGRAAAKARVRPATA
jgi:DNA-binding FadR family transcriptional regulator